MGESCSAGEYLDALSLFEQASEWLASVDPVMLGSAEELDALVRLETAARKVPYSQYRLTRVALEQNLPHHLDYAGIKELLVDQLRLAGSEAASRIQGARERAPRHERGLPPEPQFELIAGAQRDGLISERHAGAMASIFRTCRKRLSPKDTEVLEQILTSAAESVPPEDLVKIGKAAIDRIDPDGAEPKDEVIARARSLDVGKQDDDLMSDVSGALSPEGRALLDTILAKFARPGVNNPADADDPVDLADRDQVAAAAKRDTRTQLQRNHDALVMALRMAIGSGELGSHRGMPCVPIITVGIDRLESESGFATTATGGRMPVEDALRMMGANPRYVLLLDLESRPLFLGREKRLATMDQRIALYGSEKGCSAPRCDAPATRCQVHHIVEWADGGKTDITVLTLACDKHHGTVTPDSSDYPHGYETIVIKDGPYRGRTGWRRKADPSGEFRVNHAHHADELYQQAMQRWRERWEQFRRRWRAEDLRREYEQLVGSTYADIAAILDSPNGPPILEAFLAEHDAETGWQRDEPTGPTAA